jgi:GNAT superfamily N-acetyltransferase
VEIREACAEDWSAIWPFFAAIVEAGESYAYPLGMDADAGRPLWMDDAHVVVALVDGAVQASAKMGPNRPGRGAHVATASFMVDPTSRGLGLGRALGSYAVAWASAQGFAAMQFNAVVETNAPAVALWQSLGFAVIGTVPEAFEHPTLGRVGLHVMHLRL